MTCGFAFSLLLVLCEVLGLTYNILHAVYVRRTRFFLLVHVFFSILKVDF